MAFIKNIFLSGAGWTLRKGNLWDITSQYSERIQLTPASFSLRARRNGPVFQILYYHRILPEADPFAIDAISAADFEQQIAMLSSTFNLMSVGRLAKAHKEGAIPPKTACITFDDGYLDNMEYAFPILKKFNAPATIFLATDYIGTGKILWPDRLLSIIKHTALMNIPSDFCGEAIPLSTMRLRKIAVKKLLSWMKHFTTDEQNDQLENLQSFCGKPPTPVKRLMLDWNEVREMSRAGIEFGSHTITHPILSFLSDEEIEKEIKESKSLIESQIEKPVISFAYPNGRLHDFDQRSIDSLKRNDYLAAVTTCDCANDSNSDPFALSRESVWEMDANRLFIRMVMKRVLHAENIGSVNKMLLIREP